MLDRITLIVIDWVRPRPNQAHVSAENVPELGQLVQTKLAKPPPHAGNPRIILHFEKWTDAFIFSAELFLLKIGVLDHRAQLITPKGPAFASHAIRDIKQRTRRIDADQDGEQSEKGSSHDQCQA